MFSCGLEGEFSGTCDEQVSLAAQFGGCVSHAQAFGVEPLLIKSTTKISAKKTSKKMTKCQYVFLSLALPKCQYVFLSLALPKSHCACLSQTLIQSISLTVTPCGRERTRSYFSLIM
jgi:hypothetical protein